MNELTLDLRKMLNDILSSNLDVSGHDNRIHQTLANGNYSDEDRLWLNTIRSKWIRHYKEERKQIYKKILARK